MLDSNVGGDLKKRRQMRTCGEKGEKESEY
jgi:hypothetical protein